MSVREIRFAGALGSDLPSLNHGCGGCLAEALQDSADDRMNPPGWWAGRSGDASLGAAELGFHANADCLEHGRGQDAAGADDDRVVIERD